jgi:hypothetical protein
LIKLSFPSTFSTFKLVAFWSEEVFPSGFGVCSSCGSGRLSNALTSPTFVQFAINPTSGTSSESRFKRHTQTSSRIFVGPSLFVCFFPSLLHSFVRDDRSCSPSAFRKQSSNLLSRSVQLNRPEVESFFKVVASSFITDRQTQADRLCCLKRSLSLSLSSCVSGTQKGLSLCCHHFNRLVSSFFYFVFDGPFDSLFAEIRRFLPAFLIVSGARSNRTSNAIRRQKKLPLLSPNGKSKLFKLKIGLRAELTSPFVRLLRFVDHFVIKAHQTVRLLLYFCCSARPSTRLSLSLSLSRR